MARHWFGGAIPDYTLGLGDVVTIGSVTGRASIAVSAVVTFWDAETGGSQYTDLLDEEGLPVASIVSADGTGSRALGQIPQFQGPDGIAQMWAQAGSGPRARIDSSQVLAGTSGALLVAGADANVYDQQRADYLCTGVNDHLVLQAAVEEAVSRGVEVLILGTIQFEAPLIISSAVGIRGFGRKTLLRAGDTMNDYVIRFEAANPEGIVGATITDLVIDGRCDVQTDASGGIWAAGAVECSFERLHIINPYDWGIVLGALPTLGFGHHNRVESCQIDATLVSAGHGGGVWLTSSDENLLNKCTFQFLGGLTPVGGPAAVAVYDQAGLQLIQQCAFVGAQPGSNCIGFRAHDTKLTQVIGNAFDGTGGHAVMVSGRQHVVANNTITSPGDQGDTPACGVFIEYGSRGTLVTGNAIETALADGTCYALIRETGDGDAGWNLIKNNSLWINSAPTQAVMDLSGTDSIVADNLILPPDEEP